MNVNLTCFYMKYKKYQIQILEKNVTNTNTKHTLNFTFELQLHVVLFLSDSE